MATSANYNSNHYALDGIHVASLRGNVDDFLRLCTIDASNFDKRVQVSLLTTYSNIPETPLMLAALMGHERIVEFIVEQCGNLGVDLHETGSWAKARRYAEEEGIAAERRAVWSSTGIAIESRDAVNTRAEIREYLSSSNFRRLRNGVKRHQRNARYSDLKIGKVKKAIVVYKPVYIINTATPLDKSKTIGFIKPEHSSDIAMFCHSGWRFAADRDRQCLDTEKWNDIARHKIAPLLNFRFPKGGRDNGHSHIEEEHWGKGHSGHGESIMEVLLACWYVINALKGAYGNRPGLTEEWLIRHLHDLKDFKRLNIGKDYQALIVIDSKPCEICMQFVNALTTYTGIWFKVDGDAGVGPIIKVKDAKNNRTEITGDFFVDANDEMEDIIPVNEIFHRGRAEVVDERRPLRGLQSQLDVEEQPGSDAAGPFTPFRPADHWPRPRKLSQDEWEDVASRVPENHRELEAETRKKTPVWHDPALPFRPSARTPPTPTRNNGNIDIGDDSEIDIDLNLEEVQKNVKGGVRHPMLRTFRSGDPIVNQEEDQDSEEEQEEEDYLLVDLPEKCGFEFANAAYDHVLEQRMQQLPSTETAPDHVRSRFALREDLPNQHEFSSRGEMGPRLSLANDSPTASQPGGLLFRPGTYQVSRKSQTRTARRQARSASYRHPIRPSIEQFRYEPDTSDSNSRHYGPRTASTVRPRHAYPDRGRVLQDRSEQGANANAGQSFLQSRFSLSHFRPLE